MSIETRTYADADRARAAIDELSSKGFSDVKASFKPDHVRVVVNARFGEGRNAAQILDNHEPLTPEESARVAKEDPDPFPSRAAAGIMSKVEDPATPLSNILGMRVLINDPAPLSNWLGWPTLFGSTPRAAQPPAVPPLPAAFRKTGRPQGRPIGRHTPTSRRTRRPPQGRSLRDATIARRRVTRRPPQERLGTDAHLGKGDGPPLRRETASGRCGLTLRICVCEELSLARRPSQFVAAARAVDTVVFI